MGVSQIYCRYRIRERMDACGNRSSPEEFGRPTNLSIQHQASPLHLARSYSGLVDLFDIWGPARPIWGDNSVHSSWCEEIVYFLPGRTLQTALITAGLPSGVSYCPRAVFRDRRLVSDLGTFLFTTWVFREDASTWSHVAVPPIFRVSGRSSHAGFRLA